MANPTTYEKIKSILDEPIVGHPSRNLEQKINRLEEAVKVLAHELSMCSGRI